MLATGLLSVPVRSPPPGRRRVSPGQHPDQSRISGSVMRPPVVNLLPPWSTREAPSIVRFVTSCRFFWKVFFSPHCWASISDTWYWRERTASFRIKRPRGPVSGP